MSPSNVEHITPSSQGIPAESNLSAIDSKTQLLQQISCRSQTLWQEISTAMKALDDLDAQMTHANARLHETKNLLNEAKIQIEIIKRQNNEARHYDSITTYDTQTLATLIDNPNINVENFPHNVMELDNTSITPFLNEYGLSSDGTLDEKKRRLAQFIEVFCMYWKL